MPKVTVFRANPAKVEVIEWTPGKWWVVAKRPGGFSPLAGPYRTRAIAFRAKRIVTGKHTAHDLETHLKTTRRKNPRRSVRRATTTRRRNPPALPVSHVLSDRALALSYVHTENRKNYKHEFARGVRVQLLADGSVRLYRPDGRPLWSNKFRHED